MRFRHADASGNWAEDKKRLGEAMLAKACELYPGLPAMIDYVEYASPATFERYTRNTAGALYGFENTADMYGEAKLPIKTYLPNLFQVGHWGKPGGGVWNVMLNGYTASKLILRELD
jgi:prolycopene isomerase